jgi:pilus assembly protein Flp/PilA
MRIEINSCFFTDQEKAQGLVEYALILVLIALVAVLAISILGPTLGNTYSMISQRVGEL